MNRKEFNKNLFYYLVELGKTKYPSVKFTTSSDLLGLQYINKKHKPNKEIINKLHNIGINDDVSIGTLIKYFKGINGMFFLNAVDELNAKGEHIMYISFVGGEYGWFEKIEPKEMSEDFIKRIDIADIIGNSLLDLIKRRLITINK